MTYHKIGKQYFDKSEVCNWKRNDDRSVRVNFKGSVSKNGGMILNGVTFEEFTEFMLVEEENAIEDTTNAQRQECRPSTPSAGDEPPIPEG